MIQIYDIDKLARKICKEGAFFYNQEFAILQSKTNKKVIIAYFDGNFIVYNSIHEKIHVETIALTKKKKPRNFMIATGNFLITIANIIKKAPCKEIHPNDFFIKRDTIPKYKEMYEKLLNKAKELDIHL